jgi:hypothetical protein
MSVATEIVQGSDRTEERRGTEDRDGARPRTEDRDGASHGSEDHDGSRWRGHRAAAVVLRAVVFLCPVSVAGFLGLLVSRSIPGTTIGADITRVAITAVVCVAAFMVVERLARRFLPLAALLRLNLVFPDRAPSRFSVALRSTSVRRLEQWVNEARASDNAAVLAEKVVTLASALNTHDRRTRGHCERTRALADLIVEELHLSPAEANEVRWGAFLHDIGKLVVPAEILNKPGKPSTREWEILKSHPEAGARLVEPLRPFLGPGVDAVGSHHENYDGSGYPSGLCGEQLPLAARIVSVADAFEVMTAVRAYKRPMTLQAARAELARRSGSQFDPHVVRAFLNVSLGRVHWTLGLAAWLAELPFLTVLPRLTAQMSASMGAGASAAPVALPTVAAASLGGMAVIGHVGTPAPGHRHLTAHSTAPGRVGTSSMPTRRSAGSSPPVEPIGSQASATGATLPTAPLPTAPLTTAPLTTGPSAISGVVTNAVAGVIDHTPAAAAATNVVHVLSHDPLATATTVATNTVSTVVNTTVAATAKPVATIEGTATQQGADVPSAKAVTKAATSGVVGVVGGAAASADQLLDGDDSPSP